MTTPLWKHQEMAIKTATSRFALFFDPGCGKSRTALEVLKKSQQPWMKVIIFAPLNVCRNWQNEIREYLSETCTPILVAGQNKKTKLEKLFAFRESTKTEILICNIEALRSKEYHSILVASRASFLIVDESHNFKNPNSLQTKGLLSLARILAPKTLLLLTGTPAPQGEMDLWSTFSLLNKTKDNFFVWRKKNFEDVNEGRKNTRGYFPQFRVRAKSKVMFQELLSECSVTAKKDEVLDLPPLLRTTVFAELSSEQAGHYKSMREYLFAIDAEGHELNASNFLSRSLRLRQIIAGFIGETPIKDNPRIDALKYAIGKVPETEQFIIWTTLRATYLQIAEVLTKEGILHGFLTGNESAEERFRAMEAFERGELRALIANPQAGGVGVNLTAASYSIVYLRDYSLTADLQLEARNYRGGSEKHKRIVRIDVVAPDTIDEEILEALRQKKTVQDFILGLKHGNK